LQQFANAHGNPSGRPYFSLDGSSPGSKEEWSRQRAKFYCPHGFTNVWERPALHGHERFKTDETSGKAIHLNQKPLDLLTMIIRASSDEGDVVWEPFGGLFSVSIAARRLRRRSFGAEIDSSYFQYGITRVRNEARQASLPIPNSDLSASRIASSDAP
ncbi:MAG: DNA methyltransferase, partial [Nitrososphaerales archaeon]